MRDIKKEIIDTLTFERELSSNEIHKKIGRPNKTTYTKCIKELVKSGNLKQRKDSEDLRLKLYSLTDPNERLTRYIESFDNGLENQKTIADGYLRALKDCGPHIVKVIQEPVYFSTLKGSVPSSQSRERISYSWKINKKAHEYINSIITIINNIFVQSGSLTYAQALEILPKSYDSKIKNYQKNCINTIKEIINKLESVTKKSDYLLYQYLPYNLIGFNLVNELERMSKIKPKIL